MSFSLKHIRHFVAAAKAGQISRAAVDLNVSQSAVTASVQQLETLLGVRLLERRPSGVALTPAGSRFLHHADNIISSVNEAMRLPLEAPGRLEGKVRVGVTYTVAGYFVVPFILRFQRVFPAVDVEMIEAPRRAVEFDLLARRLDIAIVLTSNLANGDKIEHQTLFRSQRRLWLSAEHPLLQRPSVQLSEIAPLPYVALTVDEAFQTALRYWRPTPYRPKVVAETSSVEAVRTMVAGGMGVTILSDMVYRPWSLEGQRIETRDIDDLVPSMDVGLAWKKGLPQRREVEAFAEFLVRNSKSPLH
jgi:DNA-binding transcriptional LysR family regulator